MTGTAVAGRPPPGRDTGAATATVNGLTPTEGPSGSQLTITGQGLTATSAVTVAGVNASFTVLADNELVATVPAGATGTGPVLLSAGGSQATAGRFTVTAAVSSRPVVVIVMENQSYPDIVGNQAAPFINGTLIKHGLLFTNYYAIEPGSQHDYLAMTAGVVGTNGVSGNLFGALGYGTSWREYEESMPGVCFTGTQSKAMVYGTTHPLYTMEHDPPVYFDDVTLTSLCQQVVPLTTSDFGPSQLPHLSFVVPNECDDMHSLPAVNSAEVRSCPRWDGESTHANTNVQFGDIWLANFVPAVARYATVIVTWDEGTSETCKVSCDEHVVAVEYGLGVTPGTDGARYTHYSLEAGLYRYFHVGPPLHDGATATPLPIG